MMDRKILENLARVSGQNCISFFQPIQRAGPAQEDRIQYKNTLCEIKNYLLNKDLLQEEIDWILQEAKSKIDDPEFWQRQMDGLAVFIYNGTSAFFALPRKFPPFVYIGSQLYLKPLGP